MVGQTPNPNFGGQSRGLRSIRRGPSIRHRGPLVPATNAYPVVVLVGADGLAPFPQQVAVRNTRQPSTVLTAGSLPITEEVPFNPPSSTIDLGPSNPQTGPLAPQSTQRKFFSSIGATCRNLLLGLPPDLLVAHAVVVTP